MYYGAIINRIDTLMTWGLILLDDLEEGAPELKTNYQDVGGMDGLLDLSKAVTGRPVYGNRAVSFTLCRRRPWTASAMERIRAELLARFHGQEVTLTLPTNREHHYTGVMQIGPLSGQARDRLPVTLDAAPWRQRNEPTVITADLTQTAQDIYLTNEARFVVPTITTTARTRLTLAGHEYYLDAGTSRVLDIELAPGPNLIQAALMGADTGKITLTYTEAIL